MKSWFAVYAAYRCEFKIEESLRELGHDAWCPAWTVWAKGRRDDRTRAPLFQGYLFAGLERDVHGDFPFPQVRSIEGVVGILGTCGAPIEIAYHAPDPETWRARRGAEPAEPFSISRWMEHEAAGTFDLTRDSSRSARRAARTVVKTFHDLARALTALEAA